MNTDPSGLIEMGLVFGSLLVFLIWELVSLRRSQRKDAEEECRHERGPDDTEHLRSPQSNYREGADGQ